MMPEEYSTILWRLGEEINCLAKRVEELEQRNQELEARNQELEAENKHLKELLPQKGASKEAKAPQFKENYSVEKHKGKSKRGQQSTGRRVQDEQFGLISHNIDIYAVDVPQSECIEQRQRPAIGDLCG
jgi:regulator of replication initiation timing